MPRIAIRRRTLLRLLRIFATLVRKLDHVRFLITLIDLHTQDSKEGEAAAQSCAALQDESAGTRRNHDGSTTFVETLGVGCFHAS